MCTKDGIRLGMTGDAGVVGGGDGVAVGGNDVVVDKEYESYLRQQC